jgi:hypothetical protein
MSKEVYICFDAYYGVQEYNSFKVAAKNNGIEFEEYLRIKPPYNRFLKISDKSDLPSFVNYDFATVSDIKWLVSTVKPVRNNEAYLLLRREGEDISYWKYILPRHMTNAHHKDYMMIFRTRSLTEIREISRKAGEIKIYKLGHSKTKGYDMWYCYNPYIKGVVPGRDVLMEMGKEAKDSPAIFRSLNVPNQPGEIEYNLNKFVLVKEKLENKHYESEIWRNGKVEPLKKESFI